MNLPGVIAIVLACVICAVVGTLIGVMVVRSATSTVHDSTPTTVEIHQ